MQDVRQNYLVIPVTNFMVRDLDKYKLIVKLRVWIYEHRLHPDHLHVVLLLVGEEVVVQYDGRYTLNTKKMFLYRILTLPPPRPRIYLFKDM